VPPGDNRERFFCRKCDTIHYQNPRIIAGCVVTYNDQLLLCRRAIEPRHGYWTIPAGFMELGETAEAGALRETIEEANAKPDLERLHVVYSLPHISQVYLIYEGTLQKPAFGPGVESLEVELFSPDDIPWADLAFSSVRFALEKHLERRSDGYGGTYIGTY